MIRNDNDTITLTHSEFAKVLTTAINEALKQENQNFFEVGLRHRIKERPDMLHGHFGRGYNGITYQAFIFLGFRLLSGSLGKPDFYLQRQRGYLVVKQTGEQFAQKEDLQGFFLIETFSKGKFGMIPFDEKVLQYLKG